MSAGRGDAAPAWIVRGGSARRCRRSVRAASNENDRRAGEGQAKMSSATVLVAGLTGVGAELAKNVILAGVKGVALFDPTPVQWRDLGGNPRDAARDL